MQQKVIKLINEIFSITHVIKTYRTYYSEVGANFNLTGSQVYYHVISTKLTVISFRGKYGKKNISLIFANFTNETLFFLGQMEYVTIDNT